MAGGRQILQNLTPRGRIVLAASVLATLLVTVFMFRIATQPSYSTLISGVKPAETGKMTRALDEAGVAYELQNNGTALAVQKSQMPQARIALSEAGLMGSDKPGFELFDKQKLGASDFQQRVSYQRALEGEIGRTIGEVDGVSDATVQLTLPEDQLFSEESKPATAAVLVNAGGGLDPGSVRGMARLVASSVEGLKPENVTITDQTGQLLWPNGDGAGAGGVSKQSAEARVERELEASLSALVARTVGSDKGQVQVQATVNADEAEQEKLTYARRGTPLRTRVETERLETEGGGGAPAGGDANVPTYAQGGGGGPSDYEKGAEETDYGVDKTVTRTKVAPGRIERLDVAVVLDKSVPPTDAKALEQAVASAAGFDRERGDTLSVSQIAFAKTPGAAAEAAGPLANPLGMAKYAALGLAMLIFLIVAGRQLRRREDDELAAEPVWLRELDSPTTLAELEGATAVGPVGSRNGNGNGNGSGPHHEVEEIVATEPERVAQQVRAWMNE